MPRRSAAARQQTATPPQAELDAVLMPPSTVPPEKLDAYWLNLANNPAEFAAAVQTEDDFFRLIDTLPRSLWGDKLRLYLYRCTSDEGIMVMNDDDSKYNYAQVIYKPIDQQWVSDNWGGGKYRLWLKYVDKEKRISDTIKKHTFPIEGPPKVRPGQTVLVDGKPVSVGESKPAPAPDPRSDLATIIDANSRAEEKRAEMLAEATKASIGMVTEQAKQASIAAAKPDAQSGTMDKLLTLLLERVMQPPPDPLETFVKLQTLMRNPAETAAEPKDPPLVEAMELVEKMSGGRSFADLIKGGKSVAVQESGWAPFAPSLLQLVTNLPNMIVEFRHTRELELRGRDIAFRRDAWLRTAKQGEAPPPELLAVNPAPPAARQTETSQPAQAAAGTAPDANQLTTNIVQTICHGFDTDPEMGQETAATIALMYGRQLEALGLEKYLANEETLTEYVKGIQPLADRSKFATWQKFQDDFLDYCVQRWGEPEDDAEEKLPVNGQVKSVAPGPQSAA